MEEQLAPFSAADEPEGRKDVHFGFCCKFLSRDRKKRRERKEVEGAGGRRLIRRSVITREPCRKSRSCEAQCATNGK